ncbi:MAG: hypothetical protein RMI88_07750, partial [Nitrososphaerota archaeon]|nr:hypothetical protein [Nitrososphaerota archaeon]
KDMWDIILSNPERYKDPIRIEEVNAIPHASASREIQLKWVQGAGWNPFFIWHTSFAGVRRIF